MQQRLELATLAAAPATAASDAPVVVFRPRLGSALAVAVTVGLYVALRAMSSEVGITAYPFGVAALAGLGTYAVRAWRHHRDAGIVADERGLFDRATLTQLLWRDIATVRVDIPQLQAGERKVPARIVTLEGGPGRIAFADLGPNISASGISNLEGAAKLLAVVAARTRSAALFPPSWSVSPSPLAGPEPVVAPQEPGLWGQNERVGIFALLFKLVPKVGSVAFKLLKTIKPGAALLTLGAYSLLASWQFAVAFVGLIGFHECGHVFAMWRSGVDVKGIYFVPFVGGVAVAKGLAKTQLQTAYIAINGPVWGTLLAYACLGVAAVTDWHAAAALAGWGALLNLFNLLPIMPLDGGRILGALASSSRTWGTPAIIASLIFGAALAYLAHLELLVLMVIVGLPSVGSTMRAAALRPTLGLVGDRPFGADEHEHFRQLVSRVEPGANAPAATAARRAQVENELALAHQVPMTGAQLAAVLAGYVALASALLALMWVTRQVPGGGEPWTFLH